MKNRTLYFLTIYLFFFFTSCKKEEKINKIKTNKNVEIRIVFPDTVFINKKYDGKIIYKNALDTITTSFDDIKKNRYIFFAFTKNKSITTSSDLLRRMIKDTLGARNNHLIPLYDIKFEELGLNYIEGIITDEVMIENGSKNEKGEFMTRIITNEFRVKKGVYVIYSNAGGNVSD